MGFLGFGNRNKNNVNTNEAANPAAGAWDMSGVRKFDVARAQAARMSGMGEVHRFDTGRRGVSESGRGEGQNLAGEQDDGGEDQEAKLNAARQQRKIMAALYQGGGKVNAGMLGMKDVVLPDGAEKRIYGMIRSGEIGQKEERELISSVMDPVSRFGTAAVMSKMDDKHELRILGQMVGGDSGFHNYDRMQAGDLANFLQKYPLPEDFDEDGATFVKAIGRVNGATKQAEYEKALDSFKRKVYGKRYEYWEQMKEINGEATKSVIDTSSTTVINGGGMNERERSVEWVPGEAGMSQVSREQVTRGYVSQETLRGGLFATSECEDSMTAMPAQGIYGVFDGAGGVQGGRAASRETAAKVEELGTKYNLQSGRDLAWVLNEANEAVLLRPEAGFSTAVLTKVVERDGKKQLAWASAGDSRIYIVNRYGQTQMITHDEGEGKYITNAIGYQVEPGESRVKQYGEVDLYPGNKVVLCSDGITGDYGADLMSDAEVGELVSRARNAREAAMNLVAGARKKDDRTAIVFEV